MVNRQARNPGDLQTFEGRAQISAGVPAAANTGDGGQSAFITLANVAGSLSARLSHLADNAARREGALAGLTAGQKGGVSYLQARATESKAEQKIGRPSRKQVSAPGAIRKIISDAARRHGIDPAAMLKIAEIESSFNPRAKNPNSSAGGLFQFIDGTAKDYGLIDRFDPDQAADAAARLARDNAGHLRKVLGRDPTAGELYLAHQQGAGGAAKLLANANKRAVDIVGADAVRLNGGNAKTTAGQFANLWIRKAGGAKAVSGKTSYGLPQLSTQPLALRRDGTIRGEAFDAAAIRAYAWRVDQGLATELANADQEFGDDPAAFAQRVGEIRDLYLQDDALADPQARESFERSFAARTEAYGLKVAARQEARLRQEEVAAASDGMEARRLEIERQAFGLGANPEGDRILTEQLERAGRAIDAAVDAGTITPTEGSKRKNRLATGAARARVQGTFDALETPAEKEQFALSLLDDWSEGEGALASLPLDTVKALSTTLFNDARRQANATDGQARAQKARIQELLEDDIASVADTGQPLDLAEAGTDLETIEAALTPAEFLAWQGARENAEKLYQAISGMEGQPAAEIAERLELLKPKAGQAGFQDQSAILAAAAKKAKEILKDREADPLGQADRAGLIEFEPIDSTSAEALDASLETRAAQAGDVSRIYGTPFRAFRPGEAEALAASMLEQPDILPAFAAGVRSAFGKNAARVLGEISTYGPVAAHAAGIGLATGDTSIATDVARTIANRAAKIYTLKMPSQSKFVEAAGPILGGALAIVPGTASAAIGTAALLYEQDANRQGFDPGDIHKDDTPAQAAWNQALNRALGGRTINGIAFGGVGEIGDGKIIVPPDMPSDRPAELLYELDEDQLALLPPIASANGIPVSASQIRRGRLITAGDGLYRVALGDPDSQDPQYLATPGGRFWLLDIRHLQDLQGQ